MYEYKTRIRYSELDENGRLTLPALLDYFQDCSTFQSEDLGLGLKYLKDRHMIWALSSWQIVVSRYPQLGEEVTVCTAPYDFKGFIGYRNFEMRDENGKRLACANSVWALINDEDGKPVEPPSEMYESYKVEEKLDMDYAPRKIRMEKELVEKESFSVMRHNLDSNHHVNNGQYVRMAMDHLPGGFKIGQLRAEYKNQAVLDDVIVPRVYEREDLVQVSLCDKEGTPYCNVEFSGNV